MQDTARPMVFRRRDAGRRPPVGLIALALALAAAGCARAASCPVIDVYARFEASAEATRHASDPERISAFERAVVDPYPDLYSREVIGLASGPDLERLIPMAARRVLVDQDWRAAHARLQAAVPEVAARFAKAFPDFRCDFPVYLAPTFGFMDGAGRVVAGRPALVLGVDTVAANETTDQIPVFLTHELFHRYHFQAAGFSDDPGDRQAIWRALWAEGMATYVSARLNPERPLADALLLPRDLEARAAPLTPQIARALAERLEDVDARAFGTYFEYGDAEATRLGLPWRSGYFVGYLVVRDLARGRDLATLAHMRGPALLAEIRAALVRLSTAA